VEIEFFTLDPMDVNSKSILGRIISNCDLILSEPEFANHALLFYKTQVAGNQPIIGSFNG
jgi:hypothetical protein